MFFKKESKEEHSLPNQDVFPWEQKELDKCLCPDCGGELLAGPRGGISINVKCKDCGSKFNINQKPFPAQRLEK